MNRIKCFLRSAAGLYIDGFRRMTWGRTLWLLIAIKLVVMFGVLRVFFFRPAMAGMSEAEKQRTVATRLIAPVTP